MKYYIIFGLVFIFAFVFIFYNPKPEYLDVYKNNFHIEYSYDDEGYEWFYNTNENILNIEKVKDNKWKLSINNDGTTNISFYYFNENTGDTKYKIYYEFKVKNNKIYWMNGSASGLLDFPNPY